MPVVVQGFSREARNPVSFDFKVRSTQRNYDDFDPAGWFAHTDPIGTLKVAIGQYAGITTSVVGEGTKEGTIRITFDPKRLDVGFYPITFYAKEDDCNECLKITHVFVVQVYDPCPPRNAICEQSIESAHQAFDRYRNLHRRILAPLWTKSNGCQQRVDQRGGACNQLGRHANGHYPDSGHRAQAETNYDRCLDRLEQLVNSTRGACPEKLLCATESECQLFSNPFSVRELADGRSFFDERVNDIKRQNCCSEHFNPKGGTGPAPAQITDNIDFSIRERVGVDTTSRYIEHAELFNYKENSGAPSLRSKIVIVKAADGRILRNGNAFDSMSFNFLVKDPLRRTLSIVSSWWPNRSSLPHPYLSSPAWRENQMERYASIVLDPSLLPLGTTTLSFSVTLPNPTESSLNILVQHTIDIEVQAQFTDGGGMGPSDAKPIYGLGGKCLTHYGWEPSTGVPLLLWDCVQQVNQNWKLTSQGTLLGNGGKCVDVKNGATTSGTEVILNPCTGGNSQKWRLQNGLFVHSSGKCLNVKGALTQNGTAIILWDCGNYDNEKWSFERPPLVFNPVIMRPIHHN
ncbi:MAG: RICIN domain-containing protein [Oligoflexia bacterium]|nr:RICIN domain-containing protein [Oligoflexia bacterium]